MFINFFKRFSTLKDKLASRMIILFMFMITLIIQYLFLVFLSIKNQKFLYKSKLNFRKSTSIFLKHFDDYKF